MVEERGNVNKECFFVGSQGCLLSSSDEGNEGLETFLRDYFESFVIRVLWKLILLECLNY